MQGSALTFTPAGPEHRAMIRDMQRNTAQRALKRPLSAADELQMAERLQQANTRVVVCSSDSQWVGYFCVQAAEDGALHLLDIFVFPQYRRRGFGRQMLGEVQRIALAGGVDSIALAVSSDNDPARRLYESLGFVEAARQERPVPRFQMVLPLRTDAP